VVEAKVGPLFHPIHIKLLLGKPLLMSGKFCHQVNSVEFKKKKKKWIWWLPQVVDFVMLWIRIDRN
jgi:hypothetical protein